jgi:hypothetical protein
LAQQEGRSHSSSAVRSLANRCRRIIEPFALCDNALDAIADKTNSLAAKVILENIIELLANDMDIPRGESNSVVAHADCTVNERGKAIDVSKE